MKKKLIGLALTCVLIFGTIPAMADSSYINVYPDGEGAFTVSGYLEGAKVAAIIVYDEDGGVVEINQTPCTDGMFDLTFRLGQAGQRTFTARVNSIYEVTFQNLTASDVLNLINSAAQSEIGEILLTYSRMIGIDVGGTYRLLYDKTPIYSAMTGRGFSNFSYVAAAFNFAALAAAENEKDAAFDLVKTGSAADAVLKYFPLLGIDTTVYNSLADKSVVDEGLSGKTFSSITNLQEAFDTLCLLGQVSEAKGSAFVNIIRDNNGIFGMNLQKITDTVYKVLENRKFTSVSHLVEAFNTEIAVDAIKTATRSTISSAIDEHDGVLKLLSTNGYNSLSDANKLSVKLTLVGKKFETVEAIRAAFASAVGDALKPPPSGDSTSSGGSAPSSGSGYNLPAIPAPAHSAEEIKPVPFSDITSAHWAYEGVERLYNKGIISGIDERTFAPDNPVTREQFVKMLVMAFGLYDGNAKNVFEDVPANDWSAPFVASAYHAKIVMGSGGKTFGRGLEITREDMVVMAKRCADTVGLKLPSAHSKTAFSDEENFSSYAVESIYSMQISGIVSGIGDGLFSPKTNCTRAMAAKIIDSLVKLK